MAMPPQQQQPQAGQKPPRQQQPQGRPEKPREKPASKGPGEQTEALLDAMTAYLYEDGLEHTTKVLEQGDDIVERMAAVIGTVLTTAYKTLMGKGKTVDPRAMVRAGMEISRAVGEMAEKMGRLEEGDSESIESAFMAGLARFGQNTQEMPPEESEAYGQIIDTLVQAKESGQQGQPQGQQPPAQQAPQQPQGGLLQGAM